MVGDSGGVGSGQREFAVRGTAKVYAFLGGIVDEMVRAFAVSEEEAFLRVDRHMRPYRWDFTEDGDRRFLFEYSEEYWAGEIYLESDPWLQRSGDDRSRSRPRPMPEAGDPEFGGLALGDDLAPVEMFVTWDGRLDDFVSIVAGSRQSTGGHAARIENERVQISIIGELYDADSDRGYVSMTCRPKHGTSWADLSEDLRTIVYRLHAAGLEHSRATVADGGEPFRILRQDRPTFHMLRRA
ncbi:hypothetical protein [Embleya sp. NPDC020630]|uniref:hypothetical protein n=1 Tax=Embleya sp. NPDC020630 TaxID=3363979 RepID=UPI003789A9F4